MNHYHNNPILSILAGSAFSIGGYLSSEQFVTLSFELSRVIIFGIVGGACGYLGRMLVISLIKKIKSK